MKRVVPLSECNPLGECKSFFGNSKFNMIFLKQNVKISNVERRDSFIYYVFVISPFLFLFRFTTPFSLELCSKT
jgi:hypothetical protein